VLPVAYKIECSIKKVIFQKNENKSLLLRPGRFTFTMRNGWSKLWSDRAPLGYSLQLLTTDRPERQSRHGEETLDPDTLHGNQ